MMLLKTLITTKRWSSAQQQSKHINY